MKESIILIENNSESFYLILEKTFTKSKMTYTTNMLNHNLRIIQIDFLNFKKIPIPLP